MVSYLDFTNIVRPYEPHKIVLTALMAVKTAKVITAVI